MIFTFIKYLPNIEKSLYKTPYSDLVTEYSLQYNIDKNLVYAIIKAESSFKEGAVSHKEALGLMQLMEPTASWIADKIDLDLSNGVVDIIRPKNNIKMGCYYISYLLKYYDGNITKMLCAYNAGIGNVSKWLKDDKFSKDGENIDTIPFNETKKYVEKVNKYYAKYKKYIAYR